MARKRTYKTYPQAFKEEAVALVNEPGYSVWKVADSPGIRSNMLYRWKGRLHTTNGDMSPVNYELSQMKVPGNA